MTEEKSDRSRRDEAQDPDREGGVGSRRDEAPGQNKPAPETQPTEAPDAPTEPPTE